MLPDPLHPAIVHFPVVLAFLLPLFAIGAIWAIHRGADARRAWLVPIAGAVALTLSAWAAVRTGSAEDERVERVVSERAIESHEELAEAFLAASAIVAIVAGAGLVGGLAGRTARLLTSAGAVGLVVIGARVGHSGGELVYRHGAASAYATSQTGAKGNASRPGAATGDDEREDRDDE